MNKKITRMGGIVTTLIIILILGGCSKINLFPPLRGDLSPLQGDKDATGELDEMLSAINAVRTRGATCNNVFYGSTKSLKWDQDLAGAAKTKVKDLLDQSSKGKINLAMDKLPHIDSAGNYVGDRVNAQGYRYKETGENIGRAYVSTNGPAVRAVVDNWEYSAQQHCETLMDSRFEEVGIYFENTVWVAVFAKPKY